MSKQKCTQELIRKAVSLKSKGIMDKDIAACVGVSAETLSRWQNNPRGQLQNQLAQELKKAEGEYYGALEQIIMKAAINKDWKAAAWLLERKRPQQYSKRTVISSETEDVESAPSIVDDIGGGEWA